MYTIRIGENNNNNYSSLIILYNDNFTPRFKLLYVLTLLKLHIQLVPKLQPTDSNTDTAFKQILLLFLDNQKMILLYNNPGQI